MENVPVIVSTTADSIELLQAIAKELVETQLAACCQITGPIESIYRWDGKVESAVEHQCQIKTMSNSVDQIIASIKQRHSYDEPEIIVTPIVGGSESYLKWIADSLNQ